MPIARLMERQKETLVEEALKGKHCNLHNSSLLTSLPALHIMLNVLEVPIEVSMKGSSKQDIAVYREPVLGEKPAGRTAELVPEMLR